MSELNLSHASLIAEVLEKTDSAIMQRFKEIALQITENEKAKKKIQNSTNQEILKLEEKIIISKKELMDLIDRTYF